MVTPVPHKNYSYKAFCQIEPVFNRVKQIKNAITPYIADSMKFAFSIGNCALGGHCLVVSQANNCSEFHIPNCPITNDQVPKKPSRIRYIIYTRTCKWMKLILPLSRICVRMLSKACIVVDSWLLCHSKSMLSPFSIPRPLIWRQTPKFCITVYWN